MGTELQRRKFDPWLIHSKCGNFNELVNRMKQPTTKNAPGFKSWSKASEKNTKWMIVIVKQFKTAPPSIFAILEGCRIRNEIAINKVAYKQQEAWTEKEYFILERLNKGIKLEDSIDPLFQITSYFATSKLEFFVRDNKGITRSKPTTWRKSIHRSYKRFHLGLSTLDDLDKWTICFRRVSRKFIHSKDESKLIIQSLEQRTRRGMKHED